MSGYRHPPGVGPSQPAGVPPGYMLVDVPERGIAGLGGAGGTAAGSLIVFAAGVALGYFLGRKHAGAKVRAALRSF